MGIHDRDEPLGSVIMVFLYYLINYQLRKNCLCCRVSLMKHFLNFFKFRFQVKNACYVMTLYVCLSTVLSTETESFCVLKFISVPFTFSLNSALKMFSQEINAVFNKEFIHSYAKCV